MSLITTEQKANLEKNMLFYKDLMLKDTEFIKTNFNIDKTFCFDTESCYKRDNKGIEPKIPKTITHKDGTTSEIKVWNDAFCKEVKVYAWAISTECSDYVVYGNHLDEFFTTLDFIASKQITKKPKGKNPTANIKMFAHNLAWDLEFLKYHLIDKGYLYYVPHYVYNKESTKQPLKTFKITENNNIVYSATIITDNTVEIKTKRSTTKIPLHLEILDSYKIMSKSLEDIAKDVIEIKDMYKKMGALYDYESFRSDDHVLTDLELAYLYNDVYILKEFIIQFYNKLNTKQTTASAISFEKFLEVTFKQPTLKENYELFLVFYPDLSKQRYISNFIESSYRGGWTQANKTYVNHKQHVLKGISIDINSSYPAVIRYKPLPYGNPSYFDREVTDKELKELGYQLRLLNISFDGFKNKNEDDLIGHIQCGSENAKEFKCSGRDYVHTNIFDGEVVGDKIINVTKCKGCHNPTAKRRYTMQLWDFELESMLRYMDFYLEEKIEEVRNSGSIFFPTGTFTKGYEVEETLCFKANIGFFGDAVDEFTKMKVENKKKGNKAMTEFAKLVLNSFYGKLGSNYRRVVRGLELDTETGLLSFSEVKEEYESEKKYYHAFASCVTAWARCNLRDTLYTVGYNNVMYWDTDSLYTTLDANTLIEKLGKFDEKTNPNGLLHPTYLGKWDMEKEYIEFKSIGAKKYIYKGRTYKDPSKVEVIDGKEYVDGEEHKFKVSCKCAGLPKDVRDKVDFKDFHLGATFLGKKSKCKLVGGYALVEGEFKITDRS